MKTFKYIIFCFVLLCFSTDSWSQDLEDYLKMYERGEISAVRDALPNLELKFPDRAELLFLKAVFESDGETAYSIYSLLKDSNKSDAIYEKALWRVCEFNFARGLYVTCNDFLNKFIAEFPQSDLIDKAEDMRGRLSVQLNDDFVIADEVPTSRRPNTEVIEEKNFSIQIGAFASKANVQRRLSYIRKLGVSNAEVAESSVGGRILYKIWVGSYATREEARNSGDDLIRRYRLNSFTVVEKK